MKIKRIDEKMKDIADWLMFGSRTQKTGTFRLLSSAPIAIPLIFWATVIQKLQEPGKNKHG